MLRHLTVSRPKVRTFAEQILEGRGQLMSWSVPRSTFGGLYIPVGTHGNRHNVLSKWVSEAHMGRWRPSKHIRREFWRRQGERERERKNRGLPAKEKTRLESFISNSTFQPLLNNGSLWDSGEDCGATLNPGKHSHRSRSMKTLPCGGGNLWAHIRISS